MVSYTPRYNSSESGHSHEQSHQFQGLSNQVLELLNHANSKTGLIREILFLVKAATGFEAVGIRLKDGRDFPYYETIGFSRSFVKAEKYLCTRDQSGNEILDSSGNANLECMCGNVISGRTNPALPFFTKGGSFWTNSTTKLLASTTEKDRQSRTRNRCNREGYESVALIPIKSDRKAIGLLQLNDRRKNLFTPELIYFFEGFVSSIGIAMNIIHNNSLHATEKPDSHMLPDSIPDEPPSYFRMFKYSPFSIREEDYSEIKQYMNTLAGKGVHDLISYLKSHPEDVLSLSRKVHINEVNDSAMKLMEAGSKQELMRGINIIFNKESFDTFSALLVALWQGKSEFQRTSFIQTLSGEEKPVLIKIVVPQEHKGTFDHLFVYHIDISFLKNDVQELFESEEKYRKIVDSAHDAMLLIDSETGIIIDSNKRCQELLNLQRFEISGAHLSEFYPDSVSRDYEKILKSPAKRGVKIAQTLFACRKCNKNIPVSVNSKVITLKEKKYISVIFRDLTGHEIKPAWPRFVKGSSAAPPLDTRYLNLSRRELEVLRSIAAGKSTKEIAHQLFISETTVSTHRMRIMQKLDMHKTADIVRYAVQSGLLQ